MRRNSERGDTLIGILIGLAVLTIMLAGIAPAIVRNEQVQHERAAASMLATISSVETVSASVYGQYMAPSALVGSLANPISCTNAALLAGPIAQAPEGYTMTFAGGGAATAPAAGCGGVAGFNSFTVNLDPVSKLSAQRHFFMSSADGGLIHFNGAQAASIGDTILPVSVVNAATIQYQPSGGNPATSTPPVGPPQTPDAYSSSAVITDGGTLNQFNPHWLKFNLTNNAPGAICEVTGLLAYTLNGNQTTEIIQLLNGQPLAVTNQNSLGVNSATDHSQMMAVAKVFSASDTVTSWKLTVLRATPCNNAGSF